MSRHVMGFMRIAIAMLLLGPAIAAADVVLDWNRIMLSTIAGQNPFAQARFAAITQLAVFEAVNACTSRARAVLRHRVRAVRRIRPKPPL